MNKKEISAAHTKKRKIDSLDDLKKENLCIIDKSDKIVRNKILETLEEQGLIVSDLAKLTGISRQNINAVVKYKMKPGIDFALKVSYVLNKSVEELFTLSDNAWVKAHKDNVDRESTLYVDVVNLYIVNNACKKSEIKKTGFEFYDTVNKQYMTRKQFEQGQKAYVDTNVTEKVKHLKEEMPDESLNSIKSQAITELKNEYTEIYIPIYEKLGKRFTPYIIK